MIKAIETEYQGYKFRSRLEARWAVFFDHLKIAWEYEVEGFDLGNGLFYLPDFWLPDFKDYVEIKPRVEPSVTEIWKAESLSGSGNDVTIVCGDPLEHAGMIFVDGHRRHELAGLEFHEWPMIGFNPVDHVIYFQAETTKDSDQAAAAKLARFARFEHGQKPRLYKSPSLAQGEAGRQCLEEIRRLLRECGEPGRRK